MPIDRVEFERGRTCRAFYFWVHEFLQQNPGKAYTVKEIDATMRPGNLQHGWPAFVDQLASMAIMFGVLDNLLRDGKITGKVVEDTTGRQDSPKKNVYFMAV